MKMKAKKRDRLEHYARNLWKRWLRAAHYAQRTTPVDAQLRYRLHSVLEVRNAVRDVLAGREGWAHMLVRARRTARCRLRLDIERRIMKLAMTMPVLTHGRHSLAAAVRRAGYGVSPSMVRRVLVRRGLWGSSTTRSAMPSRAGSVGRAARRAPRSARDAER